MFDIGIGEILLMAVVGLVIFGPEKLPRSVADLARLLRRLRQMSLAARRDLAESSGIDMGEVRETFRSLGELHPKHILESTLSGIDDEAPASAPVDASPPARPASTPLRTRSDRSRREVTRLHRAGPALYLLPSTWELRERRGDLHGSGISRAPTSPNPEAT